MRRRAGACPAPYGTGLAPARPPQGAALHSKWEITSVLSRLTLHSRAWRIRRFEASVAPTSIPPWREVCGSSSDSHFRIQGQTANRQPAAAHGLRRARAAILVHAGALRYRPNMGCRAGACPGQAAPRGGPWSFYIYAEIFWRCATSPLPLGGEGGPPPAFSSAGVGRVKG
jgi:hypothetical protein